MKQHDVIISGHHVDLTPALKEIVQQKVEKLFVHEDRIIRLRVDLSQTTAKSGMSEFTAKGHIEINGNDIVLNATSDDLYKSIDMMVEKLTRGLRRRSRLRKVKQKHVHDVDIPATIPKSNPA